MTIILNNDTVLDYLKRRQIDAQIQTETKQISAQLVIGKDHCPFFVKIDAASELMQLLVFLPYALQKNSEGDMARLLHYYNKEIDMPGFGIDEMAGAVFYRCVVLGDKGQTSTILLDRVLTAMPRVCETFFPLISMSMASKISFDRMLDKAKKNLGKK